MAPTLPRWVTAPEGAAQFRSVGFRFSSSICCCRRTASHCACARISGLEHWVAMHWARAMKFMPAHWACGVGGGGGGGAGAGGSGAASCATTTGAGGGGGAGLRIRAALGLAGVGAASTFDAAEGGSASAVRGVGSSIAAVPAVPAVPLDGANAAVAPGAAASDAETAGATGGGGLTDASTGPGAGAGCEKYQTAALPSSATASNPTTTRRSGCRPPVRLRGALAEWRRWIGRANSRSLRNAGTAARASSSACRSACEGALDLGIAGEAGSSAARFSCWVAGQSSSPPAGGPGGVGRSACRRRPQPLQNLAPSRFSVRQSAHACVIVGFR